MCTILMNPEYSQNNTILANRLVHHLILEFDAILMHFSNGKTWP